MEERIGRYQILARIAAGGQATVYRARDTRTDRVVALKVLHRRPDESSDYLERFRREARLASAIRHPNVVPIYTVRRLRRGKALGSGRRPARRFVIPSTASGRV